MTKLNYSGRDNLKVMAQAHNYNDFLLKIITQSMPHKALLLDYGAGSGTFDHLLKNRDYQLECVEVDKKFRQKLQRLGFVTWNETKEIPSNRFGGIFSLNVLEHIKDDDQSIEELHRILKKQGTCLLYIPAFTLLYSQMDKQVGHLRRYHKKDLVRKLVSYGFTINQARYVDSLGFIVTLIYKLFGDDSGNISLNSLIFFDRFIFPLNRIFDPIFGYWFGKNLLVIASKNG